MELIKIFQNEKNENVISARELHNFLEVKTDFTDWCKRMFEYGFVENQDYVILLKNREKISKSNPIDYALTIDCSKEISMIQRSEKGKIARLYFIDCEKQLNKPKTQIELIIESALVLQNHESRLSNLETKINNLEESKQEALLQLNYIERSTQEVPEISVKDKIRELVNSYAKSNNIPYSTVWKSMYEKLYYIFHFSVNAHKKLHDKESLLDICERKNQLDNLFAICSKELI